MPSSQKNSTLASANVPALVPESIPDAKTYPERPHYKPGEYEVRCVRAESYYDPQFKREKICLRFKIVSLDETLSNAPIVAFYNIKSKKDPGRRSRYVHEFTIANDGPPQKRQTWSPQIFVGKIFRVRVGDTSHRWDREAHHASEIYSTVQAILERNWP